MREVWKAVVGFEGAYEVSNLGRVKSLARPKITRWPDPAKTKEKLLRLTPGRSGHLRVTLQAFGEFRATHAHVLVLEAFIGPRPEGYDSCHNDGDAANNNVKNLRWDSRKSNIADLKLHGTCMYGSRNPATSLTEKKVKELKRRIRKGEKPAILAKEFGIGSTTAYRIRDGKNWGHVP